MNKVSIRYCGALGGLLAPLLLQACNDQQQVCETVAGTNEQTCYTVGDFGTSTLAQENPEPPGDNCPGGGKRIDTGFDDNDNGVLDPLEIDATVYNCDGEDSDPGSTGPVGDAGAPGLHAITAMYAEGPGEACFNGGVRVEYGIDANSDRILQPGEVEGVEFLCDGVDGTDGVDATDGVDGIDGATGTAGDDGDEGATGTVGATGATGATGVDGDRGIQGIQGERGADGGVGSSGYNSLIRMTPFIDDQGSCASGGRPLGGWHR